LAIWAALEHPEQEYTSGTSVFGWSVVMRVLPLATSLLTLTWIRRQDDRAEAVSELCAVPHSLPASAASGMRVLTHAPGNRKPARCAGGEGESP